MTLRSADSSPRGHLTRFDALERVIHWLNAGLFLVLLLTGAMLYVPELSVAVGRRYLVERIHVYCGLALPAPVVLGLLLRRAGRGFRADLARLNRWSTDDRRWLAAGLKPRPIRHQLRFDLRLGKFNAGQKLNAAFVGGSILVMLATGAIMYWYRPWPLRWRTGSTFVHDWIAVALACVIVGHIVFALSDRESLWSMLRGRVSRRWAERHAPLWLDELDREARPGPGAGSQPPEADRLLRPAAAVGTTGDENGLAQAATGQVPGASEEWLE